jgi:hypothetical protein
VVKAGRVVAINDDVMTPHRHGTLLLMYTDGFVEAPGTSLDEGVRVLAAHAHSALSKIDTVADRSTILAERLHRRNRHDDACLLAAEPMG